MRKYLGISIVAIFLLTSLTLLSSCNKVKDLNKQIKTYSRTIKWKAYSAGASFIEKDKQKEIVGSRVKFFAGKNVVDFAIVDISLAEDKKSATAIVQYSFIEERTQSFKAFNEVQLWKAYGSKWRLSKVIKAESRKPTHLD